jgi:monoterpene epsilon-lactone hydrolase
VARLQATTSRWGRGTTLAQMRQDWDALFPAEVDARVTPVDVGGVPGEWVVAPGARSEAALLYLHGGGFQVGSCRSHRELMAGLSAAAGCRVLGLDYRLAPEHRWPAARDDALAAWDGLIAQGLSPRQIAPWPATPPVAAWRCNCCWRCVMPDRRCLRPPSRCRPGPTSAPAVTATARRPTSTR